jgi:type I site-specific restriction-modification system R (restriction) subunit
MKQAIQERFILDVLAHYTPVKSYYKLIKKVEDDPEFDVKKAQKKLRRFVEGHQHAIRLKAEMMVDHFHMKNSDKQNARIEHDKALVRVMTALIQDDTELFKQCGNLAMDTTALGGLSRRAVCTDTKTTHKR